MSTAAETIIKDIVIGNLVDLKSDFDIGVREKILDLVKDREIEIASEFGDE